MKGECIKGKEILIRCEGFNNPISQKKWDGFRIVTYDFEKSAKKIDASESAYLDASKYKPTIIPTDFLKIQPRNMQIGTSSQWTFFLKVHIPVELGCYVKLYYPNDLEFDYQQIIAQGLFKPQNGDRLTMENILINPLDIPSTSITFKGCNHLNGVGIEPYGRL